MPSVPHPTAVSVSPSSSPPAKLQRGRGGAAQHQGVVLPGASTAVHLPLDAQGHSPCAGVSMASSDDFLKAWLC